MNRKQFLKKCAREALALLSTNYCPIEMFAVKR